MTKLKTLNDLPKIMGMKIERVKVQPIGIGEYEQIKQPLKPEDEDSVRIEDIKQMFIERIKHLRKILHTEPNREYKFAQLVCVDLLRELGNITEEELNKREE